MSTTRSEQSSTAMLANALKGAKIIQEANVNVRQGEGLIAAGGILITYAVTSLLKGSISYSSVAWSIAEGLLGAACVGAGFDFRRKAASQELDGNNFIRQVESICQQQGMLSIAQQEAAAPRRTM